MNWIRDPKVLTVILITLVLGIGGWGIGIGTSRLRSLSVAAKVKEEEFKRFTELKGIYLNKRISVDAMERKLSSSQAKVPIVSMIEDIARRTGIKEKITSLKPMEDRIIQGYLEKGLEVKIEGIDLNQAVNLLYKMENSQAIIHIKGVTLKTRFDNPQLLDITLTVSRLERAM